MWTIDLQTALNQEARDERYYIKILAHAYQQVIKPAYTQLSKQLIAGGRTVKITNGA